MQSPPALLPLVHNSPSVLGTGTHVGVEIFRILLMLLCPRVCVCAAHADATQTAGFIEALKPPAIILVHGEHTEMTRLHTHLRRKYQATPVSTPHLLFIDLMALFVGLVYIFTLCECSHCSGRALTECTTRTLAARPDCICLPLPRRTLAPSCPLTTPQWCCRTRMNA